VQVLADDGEHQPLANGDEDLTVARLLPKRDVRRPPARAIGDVVLTEDSPAPESKPRVRPDHIAGAGLWLGTLLILARTTWPLWSDRSTEPAGLRGLLTAFTLWGPVIPLGQLILHEGWFDDVRFGSPGALTSIVSTIYDPIIDRIKDHLPRLVMFAGGIVVLLFSFSVFDRALPNLDQPGPRFERASAMLHSKFPMFFFGLIVTGMTLSVSLSLTILVPLTLKGYVKRDSVIPYVMGANIATWIDTLFAALMLDEPRAFTIVFVEMITGAAVSLIVLILLYGPYQRAIHRMAHLATRDRRGFAVFLGAILIVPVLLLIV